MSTLEWINYYLDLLPIAVFLFFLISKKRIAMPLWVILLYTICSFINDSKVVYNFYHNQESTLFLYIFTIVEYLLFAAFIYTVLQKRIYKRALIACSFLFTAFCLFNIFFQPKYQFDSLQTAIESMLILTFCILFLFEQVNKPEFVFVYASYEFWVIAGILIYLALTFFLFVFAASMPIKQAQQYWFINNIGNILKNIFFSIAIFIHSKSSKIPPPPKPMEPDYQPFLN